MERESIKPPEYLQHYMNLLWETKDISDRNIEYEVRFGTRRDYRKITKTNYDNVSVLA